MFNKYVGPGKLIDYSWDNPGKAFVLTGLSLLVATFVLAWALRLISAGVIEFNDPNMYDQLESAVVDAADGDSELAEDITSNTWPSACDIATDGKGGATTDCETALKDVQDNDVIFTAVENLQSLELVWADIGDAYNEYDEPDNDGWDGFQGGTSLSAVYSNRPGTLSQFRDSAKNMPQDEYVNLAALQAMAKSAVQLSTSQSDAAESFYDTLKEYPYNLVGGLLNAFVRYFILFIFLGCFWSLYRAAEGRNRTLWGFVIALVLLVLVGATSDDDALGALNFGQASGGVFDSLLGPLLAVLSQALVFIKRVVTLTGDVNTILGPLAISGILLLVLTWKNKWAMAVGVYFILVLDPWLKVLKDGEAFSFSPFDLNAFDASFILPPLVWLLQIIAMIAALYLLVGAWQHLGQRIINKCAEVCGTGGSSTASAPAAPPQAPPQAPSPPSAG